MSHATIDRRGVLLLTLIGHLFIFNTWEFPALLCASPIGNSISISISLSRLPRSYGVEPHLFVRLLPYSVIDDLRMHKSVYKMALSKSPPMSSQTLLSIPVLSISVCCTCLSFALFSSGPHLPQSRLPLLQPHRPWQHQRRYQLHVVIL